MKIKSVLPVLFAAVLTFTVGMHDADAKRLGGGGSMGRQSSSVGKSPTTPAQAPAQQSAAKPATPAPATPAATPNRWLGPIAGLAAGLGLAALASHFGMGAALANAMTMVLLGVAAFALIAFLMRRFGNKAQGAVSPRLAGAGAPLSSPAQPTPEVVQPMQRMAEPATAAAPTTASASAFDAAGFEQIAKRVFIRLQAANDNGDQADLRRFTTPEMYGHVQQELLERKGGTQRTDVLQLDARVIEQVEEDGQQIVSVRFWGLIREQSEAAAENFDEVWHLVRPLDGSREWAIAGIQATV